MARIRVGKDRRVGLLGGVWLFSLCSRKDLGRIAEITSLIEVEGGRTLIEEGDPGTEFFIVVSGSAIVTLGQTVIGSVEAGSFFGEMALLDGGPRVASVVADEPMVLLVMSRKEFSTLLERVVPSVAQRMLMVLGARLRGAESGIGARSVAGEVVLGRQDGLPTGV